MAQSISRAEAKTIYRAIALLKTVGYGKTCFVDMTPFDNVDEDDPIPCTQQDQINYIDVHLRILPRSVPFNGGALKVTLSLPHDFPLRPPKIKITTPIHHPNIGPEGLICLPILRGNDQWSSTTPLSAVIEAAIDYIDKPNLEEAASKEIAEEYRDRREVLIERLEN